MRVRATISPAVQHVTAVLESIKGLLLLYGARNLAAQHVPGAPLIAFASRKEAVL